MLNPDALPEFDPTESHSWPLCPRLEAVTHALIRDRGFPTNWPVVVTDPSGRAVAATLASAATAVARANLAEGATVRIGARVRRIAANYVLQVDGLAEVRVA